MSPFLYEPMVAGHQEGAHNRAALSRLRRLDATEPDRGRRTIRDAVGFRLIAIGVRLVDHPVAAVEDLDQAA